MKKKIKIIFFVISLLYILLILSNFIINIKSNRGMLINIFQAFSLLVFLSVSAFLTLIAYKEYSEIQLKEECNENLVKTCDELKSFKHDFGNMLQALEGHIINNDLEGAKRYLRSIMKDSNSIDTITSFTPEGANNIAAYNLIARKYFKAMDTKIVFNIEMSDDLSQNCIDNFLFCRILGILLDNAIEAARTCFKNKHIILSVFKDEKKRCKTIIIQNSFDDKDMDIAKIFDKSYSTKPGNTGIGLWKVKKILKYHHTIHLRTNTCDGYFIQTLDLY